MSVELQHPEIKAKEILESFKGCMESALMSVGEVMRSAYEGEATLGNYAYWQMVENELKGMGK